MIQESTVPGSPFYALRRARTLIDAAPDTTLDEPNNKKRKRIENDAENLTADVKPDISIRTDRRQAQAAHNMVKRESEELASLIVRLKLRNITVSGPFSGPS